MGNPFVHVELHTKDITKAKKFYKGLFSWDLKEIPEMGYTLINAGEGTGGGMCEGCDDSSGWRAYVLVEDIQVATKKAASLGAKIVSEVQEVAGAGWLSVIADPTGAILGLWQPKGPSLNSPWT